MPETRKNNTSKKCLLNLSFSGISKFPIARLKLNEWAIIIACIAYTAVLTFRKEIFLACAILAILFVELYIALKEKKYFLKRLKGYEDGSIEITLLKWGKPHIKSIFHSNEIKIEVREVIKYRSTRKVVVIEFEGEVYQLQVNAFLRPNHIESIEKFTSE